MRDFEALIDGWCQPKTITTFEWRGQGYTVQPQQGKHGSVRFYEDKIDELKAKIAHLEGVHMNDRERSKYQEIYAREPSYGGRNYGKAALEFLRGSTVTMLCDIGCGKADFGKMVLSEDLAALVYAVDIAAPRPASTPEGMLFINEPAHRLSLPDASVDVLTAFDVLEHIPPDLLDATLAEFVRVTKPGGRWIFSISFTPSGRTVQGDNLHLSVHPHEWWLDKLLLYGVVAVSGGYFICRPSASSSVPSPTNG